MAYDIKRPVASCLMCLAVVCFALPDCRGAVVVAGKSADAAARMARSGSELKLKAGQRTVLKMGGLRIKFVAVENDSRCPKNVTCVWAGNAEVLLEVGIRGGRGKEIKLHTNVSRQSSDEGKYRGYTVKLIGLSPYPQGGRNIAARDYTATLLVSKE